MIRKKDTEKDSLNLFFKYHCKVTRFKDDEVDCKLLKKLYEEFCF